MGWGEGQRCGDAAVSQGCRPPPGSGRGRKDPPAEPRGSLALQTPGFQPSGTDSGLPASRTVVLPVCVGLLPQLQETNTLWNKQPQSTEAELGNQFSWLGACGLAGAQLTRLGSMGVALPHLIPSSWDQQEAEAQ